MPSGRFQARYYGPDLQYHSAPNTFDTKGDATAWLMTERALISQQRWTPPKVRETESRRAVERDDVARGRHEGELGHAMPTFDGPARGRA